MITLLTIVVLFFSFLYLLKYPLLIKLNHLWRLIRIPKRSIVRWDRGLAMRTIESMTTGAFMRMQRNVRWKVAILR